MNSRGPLVLLVLVVLLTVGAACVLAKDNLTHGQQDPRAQEFQELVRGVGFGPAVDLSRCGLTFDPRVCPCCTASQGPIPGGAYFCPEHGCSVLFYPPLRCAAKETREAD